VTQIDPTANHLLVKLVRSLATHGKQPFFTDAESHPRFRRFLEKAMDCDEGMKVTTVSPGMGFGESAIMDEGVQSADVWADKPVEWYTLTKDAFERLAEFGAHV
jgi:CRP-like cAMP-binding protein